MAYITFKKIHRQFWMLVGNLPFVPGHKWRPLFVKWGGVNVIDYKSVFIGRGVAFDAVYPEGITIEPGVVLTSRASILTHFRDPRTNKWFVSKVCIKEGAFIGTGTIITKPVTIGRHSTVGAGSIVTKDIPDGEIWAGNPARIIGKV